MRGPVRVPDRPDGGLVSTTDLESLRVRFREHKEARTRKAKDSWQPLTTDRLAGLTPQWVLSFDQTINHTGAALLRVERSGLVIVFQTWMVEPHDKRPDTGFEEIYRRVDQIIEGVALVVSQSPPDLAAVVMEAPTPHGYRVESSLLGGVAVRMAAQVHRPEAALTMVSNGSMRALLNSPHERQEKRHVREAISTLIQPVHRAVTPWNEHVHDAVGLGLTLVASKAAEEREKRER